MVGKLNVRILLRRKHHEYFLARTPRKSNPALSQPAREPGDIGGGPSNQRDNHVPNRFAAFDRLVRFGDVGEGQRDAAAVGEVERDARGVGRREDAAEVAAPLARRRQPRGTHQGCQSKKSL